MRNKSKGSKQKDSRLRKVGEILSKDVLPLLKKSIKGRKK